MLINHLLHHPIDVWCDRPTLGGCLCCGSCRDSVTLRHKPAHEVNQHADKLVYFIINLNSGLLKLRLN